MRFLLSAAVVLACSAAPVPFDASGVTSGPIRVQSNGVVATVEWRDGTNRAWKAEFSLDPDQALIRSIAVNQTIVIDRARPIYRCQTGKRRGGWDAFFDFPPSHPEGARSFNGEFRLQSARARSLGDRVELSFDGFKMGPFTGAIRYVFFPGSRLIQQEAIVSTNEPDTAFFYDAGIRMTVDADRRAGGNMDSHVSYFDPAGEFKTVASNSSEWHTVAVKHRAIASRLGSGTVAIFPAPHQYFFARDYTTNMGYTWHTAWRGTVSLGVRQYPDDNSPYYPWMNAPPGTEQKLSMFLLLDDGEPRALLENVLRYTHRDVFPKLTGFKTVAPHWHFAYTVQAMEKGFDWTPPFKPVLKAMGVDAAVIMDFHGDGHPADVTGLRLRELDAYYRACRAQSDPDFLLIPAEEANVHLGGHWALFFPKPVHWFMSRKPDQPFRTSDPKLGNVYRIADAAELLNMVKTEGGYMYQTHPRTKGSTGYPDLIRETNHFRDPRYIGAGWKAMPSDLSSPRLGERSLKLLDDMNNWGLKKRIFGEVDVFQIDSTHELYAHMNVNYVRMASLPSFDQYGQVIDGLASGDLFVTTGEVLLPSVNISAGTGNQVIVRAKVNATFPLALAEVVWGDGDATHRKIFPLDETREFSDHEFNWQVDAPNWKWARFAVWDVAGNGAFINPVWR